MAERAHFTELLFEQYFSIELSFGRFEIKCSVLVARLSVKFLARDMWYLVMRLCDSCQLIGGIGVVYREAVGDDP